MSKTNKLFLFLILALFSIGITSCGGDEELSFTVFLGEGVNELKIGDLGSEITETLGSNYLTLENTWGTGEAIYYMQYNNHDIQFFLGSAPENTNVESLRIQSIKFFGDFSGMTEAGIKIGNRLEEVETAYGDGDVDSWGTVSYDDLGIFFNFDDSNIVEDFTIIEP